MSRLNSQSGLWHQTSVINQAFHLLTQKNRLRHRWLLFVAISVVAIACSNSDAAATLAPESAATPGLYQPAPLRLQRHLPLNLRQRRNRPLSPSLSNQLDTWTAPVKNIRRHSSTTAAFSSSVEGISSVQSSPRLLSLTLRPILWRQSANSMRHAPVTARRRWPSVGGRWIQRFEGN